MTLYNTPTNEIIQTIVDLELIARERKILRRNAEKILKNHSNLILNSVTRSKINRGYFKDLTDRKIVETMKDLVRR